MLSLLALAAVVATTHPIQARLVSFETQRGGAQNIPTHFQRLSVEFESADTERLNLCPNDVSVATQRQEDGQLKSTGTFRPYAMRVGSDYKTGCGEVLVEPGRPQTVTFFINSVPGGRHVDRYVTTIQAGDNLFELVENNSSRD